MRAVRSRLWRECAFGIADDFLKVVQAIDDWEQMRALMRDVSDEMGFRHFAVLTHEDLRVPREGQIDLRDYPEGASARIIQEGRYRRDPIMRGCIFADSAFLWSRIGEFMLSRMFIGDLIGFGQVR
jgi:LuxR family quorum-sensing system transcriptional regulator CciR